MMAGNPNWWNMHPPSLFPSQYVIGSSSSSSSSSFPSPSSFAHDNQDPPPHSWSLLLFGGVSGEEERAGPISHFQENNKLENWEDQVLNPSTRVPIFDLLKHEEVTQNSNSYGHRNSEEIHIHASRPPPPTSWSHMMPLISSPTSCVTSLSTTNHMLDFSYNKVDVNNRGPDLSSECNSTSTGGAIKKARVQPSPSQPPLKVRKEKLGDRITSLHQLVSPFGKTDTASVLLEAIGYIRFLQRQIEALSSPYLSNAPNNNQRTQQSVQGEGNCVFPEDPGQLLNDTCLKRKVASNQDTEEKAKDLRSRGLCLVPVSCTQYVGSDNGADYWAPAYGGGF